jgi:hypothetical protein
LVNKRSEFIFGLSFSNMRNIIITCFFGAIILIITGCCTKKYCLGFEEMNELFFKGFTASEIDTIMVQRFLRNSNFTQSVDSFRVVSTPTNYSNNLLGILLPFNYRLTNDIKVTVVRNNSVYFISALTTLQKSCNNCSLAGNGDLYSFLVSYKVNNTTFNEGNITLVK